MLTILRELAFGLYQLPSGWKDDAVRKLNLSALLSLTLFFNLLSARILVQDILAFGGGVSGTKLPKTLIVLVLAVILWVVDKFVITDEAYSDIKARSVTDPARTKARSFFLAYLFATLAFLVATLVLVPTG